MPREQWYEDFNDLGLVFRIHTVELAPLPQEGHGLIPPNDRIPSPDRQACLADQSTGAVGPLIGRHSSN